MRSIGVPSLSLLMIVAAMAAVANETGPVVEITPGRARAFRVGVQTFAQPAASQGERAVPGDFAQALRTQIEAGLTFSSVVLPLDRDAFLSTQATEKMGSGPRLDCRDWSQSGAEAWLEGEIRVAKERFIVTYQLWDAARCARLSAESVSGTADDVPRMGRKIADAVVGLMTGTRGAASTELAFISSRNGSTEVFVMDVFGGYARAATRGATLKSSPGWMREGAAVLYTSFRGDGLAGLYVTSRGGVRPGPFLPRTLAGRSKYRGVVSPTGDWVAVVASIGGATEIFLVRPDGSDLRRFTNDPGIDVGPAWSPDGTKLAFVSDRSGSPQIYVKELDTGSLRRITFQGGYNTSPAWSPNGRWIAYETRIGGQMDIWMVDPTGEFVVPVVSRDRDDESPTWSPDSRKLAFSSDRRGRSDIYRIDIDGQNLRRLTEESGENTQPSWGPYPPLERD